MSTYRHPLAMAPIPQPRAGTKMTLAFIGCGKISCAILSGILMTGLDNAPISKFIACVQSEMSESTLRARYQNHTQHLTIFRAKNLKAFREADVFILGFKENKAREILCAPGVRDALRGKLVISLLAGYPSDELEELIYERQFSPLFGASDQADDRSNRCRIVRARPNMASQIGKSMTIIEVPRPDFGLVNIEITDRLFRRIGQVRYLSHDVFDVGSVLVGASAAFMTVALEGMLNGAVFEGLERQDAQDMLAQVVIGMGNLMADGEHTTMLRENITSPRGMAIRGLVTLEAANVRSAYSDAIVDAIDSASEP